MLIKIEQLPKAEFSQVWVDYKDGVRLLIASSNKPSFNRALELNNMQAEQELQDMKLVTDDTAEGAKLAFNRAISHLLLDWTGIDSEPNKHFEYRKYGITTEHQRQQRKALGLEAPEPTQPSFTADYILGAFNIISRSRHYIETIPIDLSLHDI